MRSNLPFRRAATFAVVVSLASACLAAAQENRRAAPDADPPLIKIAEVLHDSNGDTIPDRLGTRVHVRGVVTIGSGVISGDRLQVYLQDDTAGTYVFSMERGQTIAPGAVIDVVGTVDQYRGAVQINRPQVRVIGTSRLPAPEPVTVARAATWDSYGRLVRVNGVIGEAAEQGPYVAYELEEDGATIRLVLPRSVSREFDVQSAPAGSRVTATGVVSVYSTSPPHDDFQLVIGSPSWIQVRALPLPPWVWWSAIAAAVALAVWLSAFLALRAGRRRSARRKRHRETLNALGAMAAGASESERFLEGAVEQMMRDGFVDGAVVHLLDRGRLRLHGSYGIEGERAKLVDEHIQATTTPERDLVMTDAFELRSGAHSLYPLVCVPLQGRTRIVGVMTALTANRHSLTPAEAGLIASAANLVALGLENVQMLRENEQKQQELEQLAISDPLTGLYNRRFMDEYVRIHMAMARRHPRPISFIAIDLDHFKRVNDDFGHDHGDSVLASVGQLIVRTARASDLPVRTGGEEFLVVMPDTGESGAVAFAMRLQTELRNQAYPGVSDSLRITASVGIAIYPDHGATVGQLLRVADASLYESKREGRDRITIGGGQPQMLLDA